MIYTDNTTKAMKLAFIAHKDQTDKAGVPYIFHPIHLAEQMVDEDTTIVALLHDVVEDTEYTFDDLANMGFSKSVIDAIKLMTHNDDTPYLDYVLKIKENPIARAVKLADLKHNSDCARLPNPSEKMIEKRKLYRKAIEILEV